MFSDRDKVRLLKVVKTIVKFLVKNDALLFQNNALKLSFSAGQFTDD